MNFEDMREKLKATLSPARFNHSEEVMKEACRMAAFYQVDVEKARIAGFLHDCGKNVDASDATDKLQRVGVILDPIQRKTPSLLHGIWGALLAKEEYGITSPEILDAITWHTTGRAGMAPLEKIIFVADYIEKGRCFDGVEEARKLAYQDLNRCMLLCSDATIRYILQKGSFLHPCTIDTRNEAILGMESGHKGI